MVGWRGLPQKIRVDNGPEFVAQALASWAEDRGELKFIEKGKPFQNGYMERFNRSFRAEVLDAYCFTRIKEAQAMTHAWMWIYNNQRPHQSLNYKPPVAFLEQDQKQSNFPTFIADENCNWERLVNASIV